MKSCKPVHGHASKAARVKIPCKNIYRTAR